MYVYHKRSCLHVGLWFVIMRRRFGRKPGPKRFRRRRSGGRRRKHYPKRRRHRRRRMAGGGGGGIPMQSIHPFGVASALP